MRSSPPESGPELYEHSAEFFDLRYAQKDYAAESAVFSALVRRLQPRAATLLDVACGTGRHLEHLRSRYQAEALDRSTRLIEAARRRLGDVPIHCADMCDFDLGRTFDVVTCFFGSIAYVGSAARLRQAVARMTGHLAAGGMLFLEPWLTPSAYREDEVVHNARRADGAAISWMYVQRRKGAAASWDIHWLVGEPKAGVKHFVEHEDLSLFTTEECAGAMRDAGLHVVHHPRGLHGYGAFLGRRERPWSPDEIAGIREVLPT